MMKYTQRRDWILDYLRTKLDNRQVHVDVLNAHFSDAYIDYTKCSFRFQPYGAHGCPQLSRDLARMFKEGLLQRKRVSIRGFAGMGFAKWVYCYELSQQTKGENTL